MSFWIECAIRAEAVWLISRLRHKPPDLVWLLATARDECLERRAAVEVKLPIEDHSKTSIVGRFEVSDENR